METLQIQYITEALLFASDSPLSLAKISKILNVKPIAIEAAIETLNNIYNKYAQRFYIKEIAEGYQLYTKEEYAHWIKQVKSIGKRKLTLSQPALETLAIIAYKQPALRVEIEAIRGVDVGGTLKTLLEHNLIRIEGREQLPGKPLLYGTTDEFLTHFGLRSIEDLPTINEIHSLIQDWGKDSKKYQTTFNFVGEKNEN